jgi:hypothetical protein
MLRRSLLADCVGQMVTVSLGIVMVSIHVRHLGVEAYRLLAINAVLLGWVRSVAVSPIVQCKARQLAGRLVLN